MADNTTLNTGSGGNTLRTLEDASSIQWPVGVVAYATTVGTPDVLSIPTAAALADNTATPTTLLSGSCLMVYDGSTWDMGRGDSTNGLLVNLGTNNDVTLATLPDTAAGDLAAINASLGGTLTVGSHAVTNAGTFAVQVDGDALTALQLLDDAVYTDATGTPSKGIAVMGTDGTNPQLVSVDTSGHVQVDVLSVTGTVTVDGSAVTQPVSGTVTANLSATDNAVLDQLELNTSYGDNTGGGVEAGSLRVTIANDSTGVVSIDDNSGSITVDNGGTFAVQVDSALPAGTNAIGKLAANSGVDIGDVDILSLPGVAGDVAHDSADSGNPVKIGGKVETSTSAATLAADGDRTDLYADSDGSLITRTNHPLGDFLSERISNTDGAATAFTGDFAASGASIKNYVTSIIAHNSSATDGYIDLRDGVAGAVLLTIPIPAGGGVVVSNGGHPLCVTTANTALAFDASAALSTVYLSVSGFKSKV